MEFHFDCLTGKMVVEQIEITDDQLIAKSISGDTNSFRLLVKRYEPRVAATVYGMLGDCPEAEDVGQETFVRFYKALPKFRGDSTVGTYITRIAMNLSLNELKRRKRRQFFFPQNLDDINENLTIVPHENDSETLQFVQNAIQTLDANFKSVVVLRLIEGRSTQETAMILGLPEGTVMSRLSRAQQKLKKILTPIIRENDE